jgi:hypothetical protein
VPIISNQQLDSIIKQAHSPSVTIQLPMYRAGSDVRQNSLRMKNAVGRAIDQLRAIGMAEGHAIRRVDQAQSLVEDQQFWQHQGDGLSVFINDKGTRTFRLPFRVDELVYVGDRFHTKPLLRLLSKTGRFYVLAISQNESRLFEASQYGIRPVELIDAPENIDELLGFVDSEKSLQFHTDGARSPMGGKRSVSFHGHGVGVDETERDKRILEYCQLIDRSIDQTLGNTGAPLVLAAVDSLQSIYRQANHYHNLAEPAIDGNPEQLRPDEIHSRAWELIEPLFRKPITDAKAKYHAAESAHQATDDLASLVLAAHDGQVDTLFARPDEYAWGMFDEAQRAVNQAEAYEPGIDELINLAAAKTYDNGGKVYMLSEQEMPADAAAAALLRYPLPADSHVG